MNNNINYNYYYYFNFSDNDNFLVVPEPWKSKCSLQLSKTPYSISKLWSTKHVSKWRVKNGFPSGTYQCTMNIFGSKTGHLKISENCKVLISSFSPNSCNI